MNTSELVRETLQTCPTALGPMCGGKGEILDDIPIGDATRKLRIVQNLSLRTVAKRLGFSAAYISDLENGRRSWNIVRMEAYLCVISLDYKTPEKFTL